MDFGALPLRAAGDRCGRPREQLACARHTAAAQRSGGTTRAHLLHGVRHRRPAHNAQNRGCVPHAGRVLRARRARLHVFPERRALLEAAHAAVARGGAALRLLDPVTQRRAPALDVLPSRGAPVPCGALECARARSDRESDGCLRARLRLLPVQSRTQSRALPRRPDRHGQKRRALRPLRHRYEAALLPRASRRHRRTHRRRVREARAPRAPPKPRAHRHQPLLFHCICRRRRRGLRHRTGGLSL